MHRILMLTMAGILVVSAQDPLVIHEWGTFTSLQDEAGRTIGGINTDEEHLPAFVHDLRPVDLAQHTDLAPRLVKSAPRLAREVTMRLETPVVYVHLPAGMDQARFDLSVRFHGGILSQFYPDAEATIDGKAAPRGKAWSPAKLTPATTSTLTWRDVVAGGRIPAPATDSPVWLAPRRVEAAPLDVGAEGERYLFYRGLAHLDAPLVAVRSDDGESLTVRTRGGAEADLAGVPRLWLADLRGDGSAAWRSMAASAAGAASVVSADFAAEDYSTARLAELRRELHAGLVADGLFADEAEALLATWQASYFLSAGQRLFFLVPQAWTDRVMPLTVSTPAVVRRVMMGRLEVVAPTQRRALEAIAARTPADIGWYQRFLAQRVFTPAGSQVLWRPGGMEIMKRLTSPEGRGVLTEVGAPMPVEYRAYLSLGRFRDALLLHAQEQQPDPELAQFIRAYLTRDGRRDAPAPPALARSPTQP